MKLLQKLLRQYNVLIAILLFGVFLGLYQLDNLPAEMWGDATAHYALAQEVRNSHFFFTYRFGGDGPVYTYLVVIVSWILGISFYTLKFTSVLVYLLFIAVMYFLSEAIFKKKETAYVTAFLAAISFWSITFARQPHARILVPLFIATTMLFAVKNKKIAGGIFLGVGMYTQASFWATPLFFWKRYKILLLGLVLTIPLAISFATNSAGFFTNQSYFGEKLAVTDDYSSATIVANFASNISANFFSFFLRGDEGFRLNVPASPHLDSASALFFFIGLLLLVYASVKQKKMKYMEFVVLPFFLIQIPSLLDIHNPLAQPNIGRMIGVIPFVYMSTAYGLTNTVHATAKLFKEQMVKKLVYSCCLFYVLGIIAIANVDKYFVIYPYFLPDHNTPFAKIIAHDIDRYPKETTFFVIGSGWSEWGQPEQQAISDSTTVAHSITFLPVYSQLCASVENTPGTVVFITSPADTNTLATLHSCGKKIYGYVLEKNSFQVAKVLEINKQ